MARKATERTPEQRRTIALDICEAIADGALIADACKPHGIDRRTLRDWIKQDETLAPVYARARQDAADALEQKALEIAEGATSETYQQSRLMIDTYKWAAAHRHPRVYGDKLDVTSAGEGLAGLLVGLPKPEDRA